jgi:hypothetical protein
LLAKKQDSSAVNSPRRSISNLRPKRQVRETTESATLAPRAHSANNTPRRTGVYSAPSFDSSRAGTSNSHGKVNQNAQKKFANVDPVLADRILNEVVVDKPNVNWEDIGE